jgi:hypothetical protein
MDITNSSLAPTRYGNNVNILGTITNNNTDPISNTRIYAQLYDSTGKLIDILTASPEIGPTLEPSDSSPFQISTTFTNKTLDHYSLICGGSINFVG